MVTDITLQVKPAALTFDLLLSNVFVLASLLCRNKLK